MSEQFQSPIPPMPPSGSADPAASAPGYQQAVPPAGQTPAPAPAPRRGGLGVAALVLGIVAFVLAWIPFASYAAIGLGGVGLILGIVAIARRSTRTGASIAGTIVSAVALLAAILMTVLYAALFSAVSDAADDLAKAPGTSASLPADGHAKPGEATKPGASKVTPRGAAAQAGDFQITVSGVETGIPQVGDTIAGTFFGEKAQGSYVLVHLSVKNTGSSAAYFTSDDVKILDAQKREFSADDAASLYIKANADTLFGQINPGNTMQGVIAFDVPVGTAPATLQYAGGLLSSGGHAQFALK
jgi:hypothetical protein